MGIHAEVRIGSLLAAAGVIWTVKIATSTPGPFSAWALPAGPLEACAVGILIWLHAKWRHSLKK